jgi:ATP-dependent DNA helicase RecQ
MRATPKPVLFAWMRQLIDQEVLRPEGEYGVLKVTERGIQVLEGRAQAAVYEGPSAGKRKRSKTRAKVESKERPASDAAPLDADERALFERLRTLRRQIADEHGVPAFMVFSDKTLRAMAKARPTTRSQMLSVKGVGLVKMETFGERFLREMKQ